MGGTATKRGSRVWIWLTVAVIAANIVAFMSPWHILVRSIDREYFVDYDIVYDLPEYAALRRPEQQIRRGKVCVYWQGGGSIWPDFVAADGTCPMFKLK